MNASVRLSLTSLRAHKRRFAGTFSAVLLGVAFLAGTLVMGDTLRASFDSMFAGASSGTDAVVRSGNVITTPGESQGTRRPVAASLADDLAKVPGVAAAAPNIQGAGQLIDAHGKPIGGQGPPTLAGNWIDDPELNAYQLADGRTPRKSGEVVINRGAAKTGDLKVGDTTTLRTPDPVKVTIVGLATFGGEDGMAQTTFTGMTRADAEKYLTPKPGEASTIQVRAGPGVSQQELVDSLTAQLPKGVEAITGDESAQENTDMISGQFLSLFTTFLLVFSGVALLVATFSIHNTFAIVVAQRARENALLRALGAARLQIAAATLVEATAVAVVASVAGLAGGIGIAAGLQALFPAIGFPFPEGDLVIGPLSMLLPLAVGIVVCVGSALLPALRAGRTAPLAALRDSSVDDSGASRRRAVIGGVLGAAAIAVTLVGVLVSPSITLAGVGAVLVLASFVVLGPVASTSAVRALGAPLDRLRGVTGGLARRNALRSPKRTAATASALMIGVAVVSLFTVFGASLKATMDQTVNRSFAGDVAVSTPSFGAGSGLSLETGARDRRAARGGHGGRPRQRRRRRRRQGARAHRRRPGRAREVVRPRHGQRLDGRPREERHRDHPHGGRQAAPRGRRHGTARLHRRQEGALHGPRRLRPLRARRRLRDLARGLGTAPYAGRRQAGLRHLQGRRLGGRRHEGGREGRGGVRQSGCADPRRVRAVLGVRHRHDAHARLRAAGPGRRHRAARHRQHPHPRPARTDPGAGSVARRRPDPRTAAGDGPLGVGARRRVRHGRMGSCSAGSSAGCW